MPTKTKKITQEQTTVSASLETPLGPVYLEFADTGLKKLAFACETPLSRRGSGESTPGAPSPQGKALKKLREQVIQALEKYFAGQPGAFDDLPLDLEGSPFHLQVWQELRKIPAGETVSYGELAQRLGNPQAARAVGRACGANPVPIIVPCHRVIAANGTLGGFSSGLERKRWLLEHEQVQAGSGTSDR
jgi:methylated-DNA-[protein]-cysteine S-methyltransferase